ncbi:potassium-transporting ATPase subunit KdpA [Streptomyces sp. NRRL F-5123]|uniref:potassium-transporting ATPase subunit KdpA n=1 Tax=Streptomyces sp. NRRL F-5123 TaxID=1463856 RepID=UPI0004E11283|nr:potassium-transporting ATPase subunit KdpA [Streptomyces sp. NRRL F-5123]
MSATDAVLLVLSIVMFGYLGVALFKSGAVLMAFAWTIVVMVVVLGLCWRYLGAYMVEVYEGRSRWLRWLERPIYRSLGVSEDAEQTWQRYAASVIGFTAVALLVTYGIFRLQGSLPFNPQHFGAVRPDTSWNTSVSFVTNTNWQSYSGETTMSCTARHMQSRSRKRRRVRIPSRTSSAESSTKSRAISPARQPHSPTL